MSKYERVARLLKIISHLKGSSGKYNRSDLARICEVSTKTIQRDLRTLNTAEVFTRYNGSGYEIISDIFLPPITLSLEEALSLMVGGRAFQGSSKILDEAKTKILSALPDRTRNLLIESLDSIDVSHPDTSGVDEIISKICEAIREHKQIHMRYYAFVSNKVSRRDVDPYALMFRRRAWYLVGHCHSTNMVLTFRLSRIKSLFITSKSFDYPKDFSLQEYMAKSWEVMLGTETEVVVKFDRRVAPLIREGKWHPTQQIEELKDGSILFKVTVAGTKEIGFWILSFGDEAEVIKPKELRGEITQIAKKMWERYKKTKN